MSAQDLGSLVLYAAMAAIAFWLGAPTEPAYIALTKPPTSSCQNGPAPMPASENGVVVTASIHKR